MLTDIFYNINLSNCTSLLHPLPLKVTPRRKFKGSNKRKCLPFTHSSRFKSIQYYILVLLSLKWPSVLIFKPF